jgi:phage-related protein
MPSVLGQLLHWISQERTKVIALILILALVAPQPAKAQLFIDWAAIVAAINAIGTAINNVIGSGLQAINSALGAVNNILNTIQIFFQNQIYPLQAINRARGVVGAVQGIYNTIRGLVNLNVASATLPNPRQLETVLLSRNAGNIAQVTNGFTTVYQAIPPPTDAPPAVRDLIDITDATSQAAMKKSIAIDDAAERLMDASDQLASELGQAAPGTAPMIEAQAAAMLVKAHALTQSAMAELFRIRAIDMANTGASLKFNANHASDTRRDLTNMFKK